MIDNKYTNTYSDHAIKTMYFALIAGVFPISKALIEIKMLGTSKKEEQSVPCSEEPPSKNIFKKLGNGKLNFPNREFSFREKWYPGLSDEDWNDWHWQIKNRITTEEQISQFIKLDEEEKDAIKSSHLFPFSITPYYLSNIVGIDNNQLKKTVIPSIFEKLQTPGEKDDPLSEDKMCPVPGIVHRYPDRVLFLTTSFCSVYCRYCTRSRMVGGHTQNMEKNWEKAIEYIRNTPTIRDVVVSGGDPLTLPDSKIEWLLDQLFAIDHIEMVRIGTKVPMVLPMRITPNLLDILSKHKPLYLSIHCTHPDEITERVSKTLNDLADRGIVMGSQTVLLKGTNDDSQVLSSLFHLLLRCRVKPYYLFQCDPITGSSHFRTTIQKGKDIMNQIRGFTSGYAVPYYVIDTPNGGGKVPILPDYEQGYDENGLRLKNYEGKLFHYPDGGNAIC